MLQKDHTPVFWSFFRVFLLFVCFGRPQSGTKTDFMPVFWSFSGFPMSVGVFRGRLVGVTLTACQFSGRFPGLSLVRVFA